jgi:hypothetical protein
MVACKECGSDDGFLKGKSGLCDSCADWHRGYDQAIREVLSAVKERDAVMWKTIRRKFPLWAQLTREQAR